MMILSHTQCKWKKVLFGRVIRSTSDFVGTNARFSTYNIGKQHRRTEKSPEPYSCNLSANTTSRSVPSWQHPAMDHSRWDSIPMNPGTNETVRYFLPPTEPARWPLWGAVGRVVPSAPLDS